MITFLVSTIEKIAREPLPVLSPGEGELCDQLTSGSAIFSALSPCRTACCHTTGSQVFRQAGRTCEANCQNERPSEGLLDLASLMRFADCVQFSAAAHCCTFRKGMTLNDLLTTRPQNNATAARPNRAVCYLAHLYGRIL